MTAYPQDTIALVRLLMADVGSTTILADSQIEQLLTLNAGNTRMAAADALDAIATSEVLVSKVIRTQDLTTDGAKVADSLRKHADRLRSIAKTDADAADEGIFELVNTIPPTDLTRPELTNIPASSYVWGL